MNVNGIDLSIIIPTFNNEQYIDRCLNSVCNNNEKIEIIIIDDGSSDTTSTIVKRYAQKFNNVHYFYQENTGVSVARNNGIKRAKGKYVFFLDSDDYLASNGINLLLNLAKTNYDLVVLPYKLTRGKEKSTLVTNTQIQSEIVTDKKKIIKAALMADTVVGKFPKQDMRSSCSKLIKRRLIKKNNILFDPDIDIAEDMVFMLHVYSSMESGLFVNSTVYYYFMNGSSAINGYHPNFLSTINAIYTELNNIVMKSKYDKSMYEATDIYKLSNLFLYLKYDIFNKQNKKNRQQKFKDLDFFIKQYHYCRIYKRINKKDKYTQIDLKKRIIYFISIHRLYLIDELIFWIVYK